MGKIIGVLSIKGGVGKTTFVINLANVLANVLKKKVLVVDANFSAPNVLLNLGLCEPEKGVHEMINQKLSPWNVIYNTPHGFYVLPSKINNKKPTEVSSLRKHLEPLREYYDFILLDSSPNVNAEIRATIQCSDSLFVLSTPDFATLSCTMHSIQLAKSYHVEVEGIIINKIHGSRNEIGLKQIENVTGLKILGQIPYHEDVYEAQLKRGPIKVGRKDYYKEYLEIAKYLVLKHDKREDVRLGKSGSLAARNRKGII